MREWFSEKKASGIDTGVPIDQQGALMEELNNDAVALSAFGFFSVSYGTIGSVNKPDCYFNIKLTTISFFNEFRSSNSW